MSVNQAVNHPSPILARLAEADRIAQKERGSSLLLRSVKWLLALLVLAFAVDVFFHLGSQHRVLVLVLLLVVVLGLIARWFFVARIKSHAAEHTARMLEERAPALGSQLINVLQLQAETENPQLQPLTRDLAKRAVTDYAEKLKPVDFLGLARTGVLRLDFKRAAWAVAVFAALLALFHEVTLVELPRFADPFGDHPPYSFTQLEVKEPGPDGAKVIYGQPFVVKVKHKGHKPGDLYLTFFPTNAPDKAVTVPMHAKAGAEWAQQIERVTGDLVVFAHTKDKHSLSKRRALAVILTPKLDKAFVQVAPPAYTGLKPEERTYAFKDVKALKGSEVKFRLASNRPLREGVLEIIRGENDIERVRLAPSGTNEVAGVFTAREPARLRFALTDVDGLPSHDDWQGSLSVTHDLAPEIVIANPQRDCFVSMDFKLEALFEASDDYGLKMIRIHRALNKVFGEPTIINYEGIVRTAREVLPLDFKSLALRSGDVITMFAEAIDTAPEPNLARSQTVNLTVITEQEYNDFLRERTDIADIEQKYHDLLDQLREQIEAQKKLGKEADDARAKMAKATDPKQQAANQEKLDSLLARQNELNAKLNKMADQMETFVRQNPVYDVERELQEELNQLAQQVRDSTKQNDAEMNQLAAKSSPPGGPRQMSPDMMKDFKQSSDEQVQRLGGAEAEARKDIEGTLQDLAALHELMKDFNRFEQLYEAQKALTEQARAYNRTTPLSREDQLALKDLAATERAVSEELERLKERLQKDAKAAEEKFPQAAQSARDLAEKMDEARMSQLASQCTGQMLGGKGAESFQLADRLREEMEKLFAECKGGGEGAAQQADQYLRLSRGMNPGKTGQQMRQSRKFGRGQGEGFAFGKGQQGADGEGGYAVMAEPSMDVLGGEARIERNSSDRQVGQPSFGQGTSLAGARGPVLDKTDAMKNLKPVNRQSGAVTSESLFEEYSDIVDKYFKAIVKTKP